MNLQKLQTTLTAAVTGGDIPGLAAALTGPDGTITEVCAGTTEVNGTTPVTADTRFWIASMTKPITSVAAMQLVEAGKLALDAPIADVLPELANPQILQNGTLTPTKSPITLRHLLTHTAGFSYAFASAEYQAFAAAHNIPTTPGARATLNFPLLFEPGTRWEYGINTDWVGLAAEAASGQTLDTYFQDHIFAPLGMTHTTFLPGLSNRAAIHQRQPDDSLIAYPLSSGQKPEFFSGGGGLSSTLNDYQKFLRIFLKPTPLLSPASIAEMTRNQIGALEAGFMRSATPSLMREQSVAPGLDAKWGLGFLIYGKPSPFGRPAGSYSWAGVANTYFWVDPHLNQAAILLMQLFPSGDPAAIKTLLGFEAAIYAAPQ
jgi:CubicO group peptidase (beta-lactamase class C family)